MGFFQSLSRLANTETAMSPFRQAARSTGLLPESTTEAFFQPAQQAVTEGATSLLGDVRDRAMGSAFESVFGGAGARILEILQRSREAYQVIVRDPIGFLRNMNQAILSGFRRFAENIFQHLSRGLIEWIFNMAQQAGIRVPERFDLRGLMSLVFQVLGITYRSIRSRMVRILGEARVTGLENTSAFIRSLMVRGPAAAWNVMRGALGSFCGNVLENIRSFVSTRILTSALARFAAMFTPVGSVIQAAQGIYRTLSFFLDRISEIAEFVRTMISSIAQIAQGMITDASTAITQTLSRTVSVILNFLARVVGIEGVFGAIMNIIERLRQSVERLVDAIVSWIVSNIERLAGDSGIGVESTGEDMADEQSTVATGAAPEEERPGQAE